MKQSEITNFCYLGERDYVQGATITNALIRLIPVWGIKNITKISGYFNFLLKTQARYSLIDAFEFVSYAMKSYPATFTLISDKAKYFVLISPEPISIINRKPYDDDSLINNFELDTIKREISIYFCSSLPLFNYIIALNKRLLIHLLPIEGFGQWFLAKFELDNFMHSTNIKGLLKLKLNSTVGGTTTRTIIEFRGQRIGTIFFSRGKLK